MKHNTKMKLNGAAIALAVAGLVGTVQAAPQSSNSNGSVTSANTTDLAHCYGVNKCKGHNDCKTADNACAGQASCKGHGFVALPSKSCTDIGGEVKDQWRGEVNTADLSHCYNVNICKGHNDCKTADNACAGHASCKGNGFVFAPAKSCTDTDGTVGA